jgi:hypothetical protein
LQIQNDPSNISPLHLTIGDSWAQRFMHRHPDLETIFTSTIEAARLKEITKEALDLWFDELTGFAIGSIQGSLPSSLNFRQKQLD